MNKIRLYIWNSKASATDKWIPIQGVVQNSLQDEITLDESYDNATLKAINKDSSMCDAFSKFYVSVGEFETEKRYYIGSEKVVRIQMSDYYEHTYTLIEPTKLLERYKLFGLSVTQPLTGTKKTLRDVCNRAFNDVYEKYGVSFFVDSNVDLSEVCPEFSVTNKTTLFEFLYNNIGKKIGAMPRLLGDSSAVYNVITFDSFSNLRLSNDIIRTNGYEKDIDEENACTYLETQVSNLVVENDDTRASIVYPSKNGWITPRSDKVRLDDDSAVIRLPYNIKSLVKVEIIAPSLMIETSSGKGGFITRDNYFELDITNRIVTEDEWKALPIQENKFYLEKGIKTKNNTLWYSVGSNEIQGLSTTYKNSPWKEDYVFDELIASAGADIYLGETVRFVYSDDGKEVYETGVVAIVHRYNQQIEPKNAQLRISYIPYYDTVTTQVNPIGEQKGALTFNQSAETVNAQELGNAMWNEVQNQNAKTILQTELIDTESAYWNKIKNIGDIIDNKIITSVKRRFTGSKYIEVLYSSSENFIKKSLYIQENREYRPYTIPAKTIVDRHIHIDEYCFIDYLPIYDKGLSGFKLGVENIATYIGGSLVEDAKINNVLFATNKGHFLLSCSSIATGNSVQFDWTTVDNYSAGKYIVNPNAEVPDVRDAPYSIDGEFNSFELKLRNLLEQTPYSQQLPYYKENKDTFITINNDNDAYSRFFQVSKDAGEKIEGSIQLHFTTLQSDIVINNSFAQNCPLVGRPKSYIKFVLLKRKLNKYDKKINSEEDYLDIGYISNAVSIKDNIITISLEGSSSPSYLSWAFITSKTDENGYYDIAFGGSLEKFEENGRQIVLSFTKSI